MTAGEYRGVGDDQRWHDVTAMTGLGDKLYLVSGRILYEIDPATGASRDLTEHTWGARYLFGLQDALFLLDDEGTLSRIDPATGDCWEVGDRYAWPYLQGACASARRIYLVNRGELYMVEPDGSSQGLGEEMWEPRSMFVQRDLHIINGDGSLYAVTVPEGESSLIGDQYDWQRGGYFATGGGPDASYICESNQIYRCNASDGTWFIISDDHWDLVAMTTCASRLYLLTGEGDLYEMDLA